MADWSAIRSGLEAWVEARTGLPAYWHGRPRGWPSEDAGYAILRIASRRSVGHDMINMTVDDLAPLGQEITLAQEGARVFTLQVQVRTFRQSDDTDALHYTSLIRDSLTLPQLSTTVFAAAGCDFATIAGEVDFDQTLDGRDMSVAQIDLLFSTTASTDDTPTGYVESLTNFELYDIDAPTPPTWAGDVEW